MPEDKQQDPQQINELIATLTSHISKKKKKDSFICRKSSHPIDGTDYKVDSWKLGDFDYKRFELPTYARGLFTRHDEDTGNHRIVVRGYDKFFNIDEIKRTKWDWIKEHTQPPYALTLKENGCIIFISGLEDGTLLVCSKHSTGTRGTPDASHAAVGQSWVERQLAAKGRDKKEFALFLYKSNLTAVAELCDDSFEEHVLAYEGDRAGLYLHGINYNLPVFATWPMDEVHRFADEWGFQKVEYFLKDNADDLRALLEKAAETGSWNGQDIEGFVIRCKARFGPDDPHWHDWFFKYKFEEPYLMYRQWRECTKAHIAGKKSNPKKHAKITKEYLKFASRYLSNTPGASGAYVKNHGIIKLRDMFLQSRNITPEDIIKGTADEEAGKPSKIVLVPIATVGCGKTTLGYALKHLFGWGHVQNDNVRKSQGKVNIFTSQCKRALTDGPVVFADRNNHQRRERKQLLDDMDSIEGVEFVCLHYDHSGDKLDEIRKVTQDRVFSRGDNHQTIHADSDGTAKVSGIMQGFLDRFEPLNLEKGPDDGFGLIITLDPAEETRKNLEIVVKALYDKYHETFPYLIPALPSPEELDEAIKVALEEYKPDFSGSTSGRGGDAVAKSKHPKIEYYGIEFDLGEVRQALEECLTTPEDRKFFQELQASDNLLRRAHTTLIHRTSREKTDIWNHYEELCQNLPSMEDSLGVGSVRLENVVWNGQVLAFAVRVIEDKWSCANRMAHVTLGVCGGAKPKDANAMLEKWMDGEGGGEIKSVKIEKEIVLRGPVKAVWLRGHNVPKKKR